MFKSFKIELKKYWKIAIIVLSAVAAIFAFLDNITALYERLTIRRESDITSKQNVKLDEVNSYSSSSVSLKENQTISQDTQNSQIKTTSYEEYIFANKYGFIQAIVGDSGKVVGYGVTSKSKDFVPTINIPMDGNALNQFAVELTQTTFEALDSVPEKIDSFLGARRFGYIEKHYFGNPGNYQNYYFSVNDAGYCGEFDVIKLDSLQGIDITIDNEIVKELRKKSYINTFFITSPFFDPEEILKFQVGPDYDQIRVLSEKTLQTTKSAKDMINLVDSLSTEVNIDYFIDKLGKPLIVNRLESFDLSKM